MTDPLQEAKDEGLSAGLEIIADYQRNRLKDHGAATLEVVEAIRTAAENDSKFNFHVLERIAMLAVLGLSELEDCES